MGSWLAVEETVETASSSVLPEYVGADKDGILYSLKDNTYFKVEEPIAAKVPISAPQFQMVGDQINSAAFAVCH